MKKVLMLNNISLFIAASGMVLISENSSMSCILMSRFIFASYISQAIADNVPGICEVILISSPFSNNSP